MPVHNGQRWLDQAIESILAQTFTDFELVAMDDGSTDDTWNILQRWLKADQRIRAWRNSIPSGIALSSNRVISETQSPLVARMDADDIAHPDRLLKQVEVMGADPALVLVGTLAEGIDEKGDLVRPRDRGRLLKEGPFAPFPHGSVMFRRQTFDEIVGYRAEAEGFEDLDMFLRMSTAGKVAVIPEALYRYRYHPGNTVIALSPKKRTTAIAMRNQVIAKALAVPSPGEPSYGDLRAAAAEVVMTRVAMCVWAGIPPRRVASFDRSALKGKRSHALRTLLYSSWGNLHPRSLRAALAAGVALRDRRATKRLRLDGPFEWRFGS